MSGPWEQYQSQEEGPWTSYATSTEGRQPLRETKGLAAMPDIPKPILQGASWVNQGIAGIPDAVLNTPTNLWNLGKAALGTSLTAAGRPELAPGITPSPNLVSGGMEKMGMIDPRLDPTTPEGRIAKTALQAGVMSTLAPAQGLKQLTVNTGIGAGSGAAGQATTEATGEPLAGLAVSLLTPPAVSTAANYLQNRSASMKSQNQIRDETLKAAQKEGFVVPPSAGDGGFVSKRLESVGGKAAIGQEAAVRNQKVANEIARREVELPPNTAISVEALNKQREVFSAPYREVETLAANTPLSKPPFKNPSETLKELRQVRADAKDQWRFYDSHPDPKVQAEARRLDARAAQLEQSIEAVAKASGKPDLVERLREARTKLAKTYDIERALNVGTGDVSLPVLGRMVDKGKLSGGLEVAGRFQQAFPSYAREGATVPTPGVSKSEALISTMLGLGGYSALGPYGTALAALPLLSGPTRSLMLSPVGQSMAKPSYPMSNMPVLSDPYLRGILASMPQGK